MSSSDCNCSSVTWAASGPADMLAVEPADDAAQHAVHESGRIRAAKGLGCLDGLVDRHLVRHVRAVEQLVGIYEFWESVDPGRGWAEQAAEWRAKLEGLPAP